MKNIIILLLTAVVFSSCATSYRCYPSKKSKDYAVRIMYKQLDDGYWLFQVTHGFKDTKSYRFECFPDSAAIAKL